MGQKLSGLLAALWLISGLAEGAMAASPRLKASSKPSTARKATFRVKPKAPKKLQAVKRITRKAQRVALYQAAQKPKPRKKLKKIRQARVTTAKPRAVRVRRVARTHRVPRRYIRSFHALVTAYVPINTPMEGGRWTCTMRDGWKTHGIAVDPKYIPLGSLLYVPGYGRALADDTGGRIKGRHIDVRRHSIESMERWGVKRLRVYVLKHPKKKKRVPRALSV